MLSTCYSCKILMIPEVSRHISEKYSSTKFHQNPSSGSRVVQCWLTDRQTYLTNNIRFTQLYEKSLKTANPWSTVHLEKPIVAQRVKKPPPPILWTTEFHYRIQNRSLLVPILSQINSLHILAHYFFNNIFQYQPRTYASIFHVVSFLQIYPRKFLSISLLPCTWNVPRPSHKKSRSKSN